jgi:hypothetical protein
MMVSCTPAKYFCVGSTQWTCTASGHDGYSAVDCSQWSFAAPPPSTANPETCSSSQCNTLGTYNCCRHTNPTCTWNMTAPEVSSGSVYNYEDSVVGTVIDATHYETTACSMPSISMPRLTGYWNHTRFVSTTEYFNTDFGVNIDTSTLTPGVATAYTAGQISSFTQTHAMGGTNTTTVCNSWTGNVTLNSGFPSWSFTLALTCADAGKSSITLAGTWSGTI